jgi:hypothetical protein
MRSASVLSALVGAVALFALVPAAGYADIIDDPLHGFCAGCSDNGTVTPIPTNPPNNFTFTASPGPQTGELFVDILLPNVGTAPTSLTVSVTGSPNVTANRVDTVFNSGDLATFLGFCGTPCNTVSPANPIGGFPGSTTGFFVFQADLGLRTLGANNNPGAGPNLDVEQFLPLGSSIVAFLNTNVTGGSQNGFIATALSGQLFVPGPAVGAGLPGLLAACGSLLALARRRRRLQAA